MLMKIINTKQEKNNAARAKAALLSVHIKDFEYWREKIFSELIAKTQTRSLETR